MYLFSSAAPQRTAYSEVLSKMAAPIRIGSPLYAGQIAGFEPGITGLQSCAATNEPLLLPTTEPQLVPMSNLYSLINACGIYWKTLTKNPYCWLM